MLRPVRLLRLYASLVKFEHTIFALPFAYAGMVLAAFASGMAITLSLVAWVSLAMVAARTLAMTLNRLIDARLDAANARTASREIPAGKVTRAQAALLAAAALAALLAAVWQLHPVTRLLWPIPVALFVLYPYTKRFTWMCHAVLGLTLGLAPVAAWLATTGELTAAAIVLGLSIALWVAGFDVIYATQDEDFDRQHGLHSLPARFGVATSLRVTRLLHALSIAGLVSVGALLELRSAYWVALAVVSVVIAYENSIVRPHDLSRVNAAFFTANGVVAIVFATGVVAAAMP